MRLKLHDLVITEDKMLTVVDSISFSSNGKDCQYSLAGEEGRIFTREMLKLASLDSILEQKLQNGNNITIFSGRKIYATKLLEALAGLGYIWKGGLLITDTTMNVGEWEYFHINPTEKTVWASINDEPKEKIDFEELIMTEKIKRRAISCFNGLITIKFPESWLEEFDTEHGFANGKNRKAQIYFRGVSRAYEFWVELDRGAVFPHYRQLSIKSIEKIKWGSLCDPWESYATTVFFGANNSPVVLG